MEGEREKRGKRREGWRNKREREEKGREGEGRREK